MALDKKALMALVAEMDPELLEKLSMLQNHGKAVEYALERAAKDDAADVAKALAGLVDVAKAAITTKLAEFLADDVIGKLPEGRDMVVKLTISGKGIEVSDVFARVAGKKERAGGGGTGGGGFHAIPGTFDGREYPSTMKACKAECGEAGHATEDHGANHKCALRIKSEAKKRNVVVTGFGL